MSRVLSREVVDLLGPERVLGPHDDPVANQPWRRLPPSLGFRDEPGEKMVADDQAEARRLTPRERAVLQVTEQLGVEPMQEVGSDPRHLQELESRNGQAVVGKLVDAYLQQHVNSIERAVRTNSSPRRRVASANG